MSAGASKPARAFHSDSFAEQYRAQGGAQADAQAKLLLDIPGVAQVYEKNGFREICLCERIREAALQAEAKLSGDWLRFLGKQRHVRILALLRQTKTVADLQELAKDNSFTDIGRAVVELIGTPLSRAAKGYMNDQAGVPEKGEQWRNEVHDLQSDLCLALARFDQMNKGEIRRSKEATMRLTAISFTEDCLARKLRFPTECEIREHLSSRGLHHSGSTQRSIERQWNRVFQWWRGLFTLDE